MVDEATDVYNQGLAFMHGSGYDKAIRLFGKGTSTQLTGPSELQTKVFIFMIGLFWQT